MPDQVGDCSVAGFWFGDFCIFSRYRSYFPPVLQGSTLTKEIQKILPGLIQAQCTCYGKKMLVFASGLFY